MAEEHKQEPGEKHPEGYHVHADGTVHAGEHHHEEHHEEEDKYPANVVTIEEAGAVRKPIKIQIAGERIQGKMKDAFGELQRDAVLPGFRKGRAPKRLLEKRFGGEMKNTVKGQLVSEAYEKAVADNKLDAIGEPEVDLTKVELPESGPLEVAVEVEVTPEFELPVIEGLEVKKPILEANEERQNLAMDNLRRHFGHWENTNAAATDQDAVLADVKVQGEDNAIIAEHAGAQLAVKPGVIAGVKLDDLGEKLKGAAAGSTVELEAVVPQEHDAEALRGKKIKVTLAVKEVRRLEMPEANEDLAKMLGFENLDELKKDLKERLVTQLEQEGQGVMAQQVYRYLLTNTNVQLPEKLSQRQSANVFRRRATELLNKGTPEAEITQHLMELRSSASQQAIVDLKLFFILTKLAGQFGIDVSEEEVNARIAQIAAQYGRRPERMRHEMAGDGRLEQLFVQLRDGKVVSKLLETAKITEVDEKVLAEEFKKLPPLTGLGPNIQGVSTTSKPAESATPANAT